MNDAIVAHSHEMIRRGSKSFAAAAWLFDPATRSRAYMLYAWSLELISKCAHELAFVVENKNRWMILLILAALMDHIKEPVLVHGDVMRGLPAVLVRQLRPVVEYLVSMLALANDQLLLGLLRGEDPRCGERRSGSGGGGEKAATRD